MQHRKAHVAGASSPLGLDEDEHIIPIEGSLDSEFEDGGLVDTDTDASATSADTKALKTTADEEDPSSPKGSGSDRIGFANVDIDLTKNAAGKDSGGSATAGTGGARGGTASGFHPSIRDDSTPLKKSTLAGRKVHWLFLNQYCIIVCCVLVLFVVVLSILMWFESRAALMRALFPTKSDELMALADITARYMIPVIVATDGQYAARAWLEGIRDGILPLPHTPSPPSPLPSASSVHKPYTLVTFDSHVGLTGSELSYGLLRSMNVTSTEQISYHMRQTRMSQIESRLTRENYITASLFFGMFGNKQGATSTNKVSKANTDTEESVIHHVPFIDHIVWVRPFLPQEMDPPRSNGDWTVKVGFFDFKRKKKVTFNDLHEMGLLQPQFFKSQERMVQSMRPLSSMTNLNKLVEGLGTEAKMIDDSMLNQNLWKSPADLDGLLKQLVDRADGHICIDHRDLLNFPYCGDGHEFSESDPYVTVRLSVMGAQDFLSASASLLEDFDKVLGISSPKPVLVHVDYSFFASHSRYLSSVLQAGATETAADLSVDWMKDLCAATACTANPLQVGVRRAFYRQVMVMLTGALQQQIFHGSNPNPDFFSSHQDTHSLLQHIDELQHQYAASSKHVAMQEDGPGGSASSLPVSPLAPFLPPAMLNANVRDIVQKEHHVLKGIEEKVVASTKSDRTNGGVIDSRSLHKKTTPYTRKEVTTPHKPVGATLIELTTRLGRRIMAPDTLRSAVSVSVSSPSLPPLSSSLSSSSPSFLELAAMKSHPALVCVVQEQLLDRVATDIQSRAIDRRSLSALLSVFAEMDAYETALSGASSQVPPIPAAPTAASAAAFVEVTASLTGGAAGGEGDSKEHADGAKETEAPSATPAPTVTAAPAAAASSAPPAVAVDETAPAIAETQPPSVSEQQETLAHNEVHLLSDPSSPIQSMSQAENLINQAFGPAENGMHKQTFHTSEQPPGGKVPKDHETTLDKTELQNLPAEVAHQPIPGDKNVYLNHHPSVEYSHGANGTPDTPEGEELAEKHGETTSVHVDHDGKEVEIMNRDKTSHVEEDMKRRENEVIKEVNLQIESDKIKAAKDKSELQKDHAYSRSLADRFRKTWDALEQSMLQNAAQDAVTRATLSSAVKGAERATTEAEAAAAAATSLLQNAAGAAGTKSNIAEVLRLRQEFDNTLDELVSRVLDLMVHTRQEEMDTFGKQVAAKLTTKEQLQDRHFGFQHSCGALNHSKMLPTNNPSARLVLIRGTSFLLDVFRKLKGMVKYVTVSRSDNSFFPPSLSPATEWLTLSALFQAGYMLPVKAMKMTEQSFAAFVERAHQDALKEQRRKDAKKRREEAALQNQAKATQARTENELKFPPKLGKKMLVEHLSEEDKLKLQYLPKEEAEKLTKQLLKIHMDHQAMHKGDMRTATHSALLETASSVASVTPTASVSPSLLSSFLEVAASLFRPSTAVAKAAQASEEAEAETEAEAATATTPLSPKKTLTAAGVAAAVAQAAAVAAATAPDSEHTDQDKHVEAELASMEQSVHTMMQEHEAVEMAQAARKEVLIIHPTAGKINVNGNGLVSNYDLSTDDQTADTKKLILTDLARYGEDTRPFTAPGNLCTLDAPDCYDFSQYSIPLLSSDLQPQKSLLPKFVLAAQPDAREIQRERNKAVLLN